MEKNLDTNTEIKNNEGELTMENKGIETMMEATKLSDVINGDKIEREIEVITNEVNKKTKSKERLTRAVEICENVVERNEESLNTAKKFLDIKLVKDLYTGFDRKILLVVITFKQDSIKEPLVVPYIELNKKTDKIMDELLNYMVLTNISAKSIMDYVEELYIKEGVTYDNTLTNGDVETEEAYAYYNDLIYYIKENDDEFVTLESNEYDENKHKGVFFKNGRIAVTCDFLNKTIFLKEDYDGEVKKLSSNKRGKLITILKQNGLLFCPRETRKDDYRHLRADKSDDKVYVYIFIMDNSIIKKEIA